MLASARSYVPEIFGDKDPCAWYDELIEILRRVTLSTPSPPKDLSSSGMSSELSIQVQLGLSLARTHLQTTSVPNSTPLAPLNMRTLGRRADEAGQRAETLLDAAGTPGARWGQAIARLPI